MLVKYKTTMHVNAKIPNAAMGAMRDRLVARNAKAVVMDVTSVALAARLAVYSNRVSLDSQCAGRRSLCRKASNQTKIVSASIPSMINNTRVLRES